MIDKWFQYQSNSFFQNFRFGYYFCNGWAYFVIYFNEYRPPLVDVNFLSFPSRNTSIPGANGVPYAAVAMKHEFDEDFFVSLLLLLDE